MDDSRQKRLFAENESRISPPEPGLYLGTSGWSYADWEGTLYPEVLPDDTLEGHYSSLERMRPHGCYEGFVFIGHMVEDENGDRELYDKQKDPFQLENSYRRANRAFIARLEDQVRAI